VTLLPALVALAAVAAVMVVLVGYETATQQERREEVRGSARERTPA